MEDILDIINEINPYINLNINTDLFEEGVLDSAGFIFLVSSLEEKYEIEIPDDELKPENFQNVQLIKELLLKLK